MLVRTRTPTPSIKPSTSSTRSFFAPTALRTPTVDAAWSDGALVLTVDLPGVPASAVDVSVAGRTLTVAAHTERSTGSAACASATRSIPSRSSLATSMAA